MTYKTLSELCHGIIIRGCYCTICGILDKPESWTTNIDFSSKVRPFIGSYYSIYQSYLIDNVDIDKVFSKNEVNIIFNLIETLDLLNLELVKQILIMRKRECITLK